MSKNKIWIIYDEWNGEIFFKGTKDECKEEWWSYLLKQIELCGYCLKEVNEAQLCSGCDTLLSADEDKICSNCLVKAAEREVVEIEEQKKEVVDVKDEVSKLSKEETEEE